MKYSKEIAVDCPNCGKNKIGHHYCHLIDNYSYKNGYQCGGFVTINNSTNDVLKNDIVCFDTKNIVEIICNHCQYKRLVMLNDELNNIEKTIYPILPEGKSLPDCIDVGVRKDFDEARLIVNYSVRCAVGLLRICGEKLCNFIADKYITNEDVKKEIIEKQNKLQPKIDLLVKYRKDFFSFISEGYIKQLEIVKDAGNSSLHSREILDEYTKNDFDTLCTIITAICNTIEVKEESDKRINALKQKNVVNK